MRRLGELLVAEGLLSESAINRALGYQRASVERIKLGSILLNWDLLAEDALLETLAKFHRCPAASGVMLAQAPIEAVRLLASAAAARLAAIPYAFEKNGLRVAFANPSNLAAIDEVSFLTRKRIVPGVTTEVRLLQAQQKFYGRHIPHEFRTILQKMDRRTGQTRRPMPVQNDLPAKDSIGAGEEPSAEARVASPSARSSARPIPVDPGLDSMSPPELPSFGRSESDLLISDDSIASVPPVRSRRLTDPASRPPASSPAEREEDPIRSGEDSLTQWVGEALTSFQRERGIGETASPSDETSASPAAASPPDLHARPGIGQQDSSPFSSETEDDVSGMWRPSPLEDSDESVTGMWTSSEEEAGPQLWEARSREEIGEAVLQNALTSFPRVILFGAGKTAITGWRGRGPNLTPQDIVSVRISTAERSVFTSVEQSGVPHFGLADRDDWPRALGRLFGSVPLDCAVFPIRVLDGVAAFLYADRLGHPMQYTDFALVARAAAATANVLSRFLLQQNTSVG
jgi:hypothetical protein